MKILNSKNIRVRNILFLTALCSSVGGALVSVAAAHLELPIIAWAFIDISLIGFVGLLALGSFSLIRTLSRSAGNRPLITAVRNIFQYLLQPKNNRCQRWLDRVSTLIKLQPFCSINTGTFEKMSLVLPAATHTS